LKVVGLIVAEAVNCFLKAIEIHTDMVCYLYFICIKLFSDLLLLCCDSFTACNNDLYSVCVHVVVHLVVEYYTAKHVHAVGTKF